MIVSKTLNSLYYLRLFGEIAPLIDIIILIVWDIRYFLMIFLIVSLSFVLSFYLVGQNQFELAEGDESLIPEYATARGAIMHVVLSGVFGESSTD
jgi:hypothetical protein